MAPATACLETTVLSYPTAHDARDQIIAAHQRVTRAWWESQRQQVMTDKHRVASATSPIADDPIVAEVRATREALAAALNYDLARIVDDLRQVETVERTRGRQIVAPLNPVPGAAA